MLKRLQCLSALVALSIVASACSSGSLGQAASPGGAVPSVRAASAADPFAVFHANIAKHPIPTRDVCPWTARPGYARCFSIMRTDIGDALNEGYRNEGFHPHYYTNCSGGAVPYCYEPSDLWSAYNLASVVGTHGKGVIVAIVDFMDDPHAATDLATYRSKFKLPVCGTGTGCFKKVSQTGSTTVLPATTTDTGETSLDVDMVSAICPECKILLVETNSASFADIDAAENEAVKLGAKIISNSFGGPQSVATDLAWAHTGVVQVASAGDWGYLNCGGKYSCTKPNVPASYPNVVAVGGTTLLPDSKATRKWQESVWNCYYDQALGEANTCTLSSIYATDSGCSLLTAKPAWQTDTGCTKRSSNDVAAVADLATGVIVYDTNAGGFQVFGGTSVASPIISAIFALAGNATTRHGAEEIWQGKGAHLNPVEFGDDVIPFTQTCPTSYAYICFDGVGYAGSTGWGTPNGISAF